MRTFKYQMVIDYIKREFIDNPASSGEIPSEPVLAQQLEISRFPINQAVTRLGRRTAYKNRRNRNVYPGT